MIGRLFSKLDQNTRVEFESGSEIYLQSGRIYFDSMPSGIPTVRTDPDKAKLTIRTDAGTVRHWPARDHKSW